MTPPGGMSRRRTFFRWMADYAWLGVEITLFRDGDSRTISATKSSYKELTQALLDLGIPAEDIGEINID